MQTLALGILCEKTPSLLASPCNSSAISPKGKQADDPEVSPAIWVCVGVRMCYLVSV